MAGRSHRTANVPRSRQAANGFTLVEIMVAALLLLVMAAAFVPLFLTGLGQASSVRNKSLATNIAREKMEQVRQLDYREIQDNEDDSDPRNLRMRFGSAATVRGIPFTISYQVGDVQPGELKPVTITVSWVGPSGSSGSSSEAVLTTLIHQQYVGPRGARLTFTPTSADPLGTPFELLQTTVDTVARYEVAQADWSLVYDNFNQMGEHKKPVYMRLFFVDDTDAVIPVGPAADDYKIDTTWLYHTGAGTPSESVYFEYPFDAGTLPDGYLDAKAVIYNEYDEPGNVYKLRIRIENGGPGQPVVTAAGQEDNQSFVVTWVPGPERDRAFFTLEWQKRDDLLGWTESWVTLAGNLSPTEYTFTHVGHTVADPLDPMALDPWGSIAYPHAYQYRVVAVDIAGQSSTPGIGEGYLPPSTTSTTSSTSSTLATTSTTAPASTTTTVLSSAKIKNGTKLQWTVVVVNSAGTPVATGTLTNGKEMTTGLLPPGNYVVTATAPKTGDTRTGTFLLPDQAGDPPAFTILL